MHPKTIFIIIISCLICLLGVGVVQAADDGSDEAVFSLQNSIESLDMEFLDGYKSNWTVRWPAIWRVIRYRNG